MNAALVILAVTIAAGLLLFVSHKIGERRKADIPADAAVTETETAPDSGQECCGMHITCEKDSLLQGVSAEIVYYDDEELDACKGIAADAYTDSQIEEFRDVLLTLLPQDIAGWARSLQLRGIVLPEIVKEELLMIVSEQRDKQTKH